MSIALSAALDLKGPAAEKKELYIVVGKTGWIGQKLGELLTAQGKTWRFLDARLEDRTALAAELDRYKPTFVLNAAGVTGRPNVDWCEDHKQETIRANVIGLLTLCELTDARKIHLTNFATGCIYSYDAAHPIGGKKFTEDDPPNFDGSFYSLTKGYVERMVRESYPNTLVLRLRMPISDDLNPRNFITKITRYAKVVNIPNSMTILHDMLPIGIKAAERRLTGVYNFTNPGAISHNQILDLYKQYIDPEFKYVNFSEEEQNLILKAKRSNNELDTTKLETAFPELKELNVHTAIVGVFTRMKAEFDRQKAAAAKAAADAEAKRLKDREPSAAEKAATAAKAGMIEGGHRAADGASTAGHAAADGARAAGHAAHDGAVAAGHAAHDGAVAAGHGARDGAVAAGNAAAHGASVVGGGLAAGAGAIASALPSVSVSAKVKIGF